MCRRRNKAGLFAYALLWTSNGKPYCLTHRAALSLGCFSLFDAPSSLQRRRRCRLISWCSLRLIDSRSKANEGQLRGAYIRYRVRRLKNELELYARENRVGPTKAAVAAPIAKAPKLTCSLCGEKLRFFNKTSTSMCKSCHTNMTTINRR